MANCQLGAEICYSLHLSRAPRRQLARDDARVAAKDMPVVVFFVEQSIIQLLPQNAQSLRRIVAERLIDGRWIHVTMLGRVEVVIHNNHRRRVVLVNVRFNRLVADSERQTCASGHKGAFVVKNTP